MKRKLFSFAGGALLLTSLQAQDEAPDWEIYESPNYDYSIYYVELFEQDVYQVEKWIDHAHEVGFEKYELEETYAPLRVKLYPGAGIFDLDRRIYVGSTWYSGGESFAEIPYITPSSPDRRTCCTTLNYAQDDIAVSAKNLVHETIHHIQRSIREDLDRSWPWDPQWFSEGMAEYEGIRYIIDHYKPRAFENLLDSLERSDRRYRFSCCWGLSDVPSIQITDVYNASNLFMWHLAETLGDEIHNDLMRYKAKSFSHGLANELAARATTLPDVFREFQDWVNVQRPLTGGNSVVRIPVGPPACERVIGTLPPRDSSRSRLRRSRTSPLTEDYQRKFSDGESTVTIEYELDAAKGEAKLEAVIVNNGPTQVFTVLWRPIDADCHSTHPDGEDSWWSLVYEKSVSGRSTGTFSRETSGDIGYPISANTKWLEWWVRTPKVPEWENLEPKTKCEQPFRGL